MSKRVLAGKIAHMDALTSTYAPQNLRKRLGRHHFAHLRSVIEGISVQESAERYLGIEHGYQAKTANRQVIDAIQAIARRQAKAAWRLIGVAIRQDSEEDVQKPALHEFIEQRGLDDWSAEEVVTLYQVAFPPNRKSQRNQRLKILQLQLLAELEQSNAETPQIEDPISAWFDDLAAARLEAAGLKTLGDLHRKIQLGGQWYARIRGVGADKAERIAHHLKNLLPHAPAIPRVIFHSSNHALPPSELKTGPAPTSPLRLSTQQGQHPVAALPSPALSNSLTSASSDLEAVEAWVQIRAVSKQTAKSYRREAHRLLLWMRYECNGLSFKMMQVEDCKKYQQFLEAIPDQWMSRRHLSPGMPGWAPFRGQLLPQSRKQALVIVSSLFAWLTEGGYLQSNPWTLMGKKRGAHQDDVIFESKAFSEDVMAKFLTFLESQAPSPSRARMRFILLFLESVGLRSSEFLSARLGDLQCIDEGWFLQVQGKGSKKRLAAIPQQALESLSDYLADRGLNPVESNPEETPLLASTLDPMEPIGYQALYETVRGWVKRFLSQVDLPTRERRRLTRASTHWLRHTFGTRSVARSVPLDVIQAQLGHASITTTANIYGRAPIRRSAEELAKAFG